MNYLKEINAFYDWLETNELSASAVNLWFALMHINNKAGWVETFTVAESTLSIKTRLSGRTIRNARNELKQKERIDFKSRKGGKAPVYKIISFDIAMVKSTENNSLDSTEEKSCTEINSVGCAEELSEGISEDTSTLYKLNETKLKKEIYDPIKEIKYIFENSGMGTVNASIAQILINISESYPLDLVDEAFKRARKNKANRIQYVEKILINWDEKGIKSINQLNLYEKNKRNEVDKNGDYGDKCEENNQYRGVKKLRLGGR
ncbi:DnaD domain protein [Tepidibacter mesophilus]|uniref:DnaD domain protein n=1 Tax=Tepidibacter mesophilus TaxID=655607 RepID=UPI000C088216|nr:DnaD domain protein [Tepidibacter mesophilus]